MGSAAPGAWPRSCTAFGRAQSWGVGDLVDLEDLAVWSAAEHGADYVLINPLHAAEPGAPMEPSPYLPTSRRFANPMYLRLERIPEYATARRPAARPRSTSTGSSSRSGWPGPTAIDRNLSWDGQARGAEGDLLGAADARPGERLSRPTVTARAGADRLRDLGGAGRDPWPLREWPAELPDPDSPGVAAFAAEHADRVEFHCWLQWLLDEQLAPRTRPAAGPGWRSASCTTSRSGSARRRRRLGPADTYARGSQ